MPRFRDTLAAVMVVALAAGCSAGPIVTVPPSHEDNPSAQASAEPSLTASVAPSSTPAQAASPTAATFKSSAGDFAFGPDGRLYTTDCGSFTSGGLVMVMETVDTARRIAGDPTQLLVEQPPFGDGGPAIDASLACASGIAFDHDGRLLIGDHNHNRIRRIEADGTITTIVGLASPPVSNGGSFSGDGGPAIDATLDAPRGITVDAAGNLYIADRENDRVRKVDPDGIITTLAGNGDETFHGDGGPATEASLDFPLSTAVDPSGVVYIADDNHNRVRRVAADGTISTVIGDGTFASGGDGGPASKAQVNDPQGVALDAAGNLYVSEYGGDRVRRIAPDGTVTTLASDVPQPGMLAIGPDGALYTQDQENRRILRIDLVTGGVTIVAGGAQGITVF